MKLRVVSVKKTWRPPSPPGLAIQSKRDAEAVKWITWSC